MAFFTNLRPGCSRWFFRYRLYQLEECVINCPWRYQSWLIRSFTRIVFVRLFLRNTVRNYGTLVSGIYTGGAYDVFEILSTLHRHIIGQKVFRWFTLIRQQNNKWKPDTWQNFKINLLTKIILSFLMKLYFTFYTLLFSKLFKWKITTIVSLQLVIILFKTNMHVSFKQTL